METLTHTATRSQPPRLRAMIEIIDGELKIFPIADSDEQAKEIVDALRFFREDFKA